MQILSPGTRIGQYEIASLPMMGGMGVVYFALDHGNDGRPVALKTFRPELLPDRAARDRFLREGTTWVELGNHPHIVRCYKVEYIDPTAFLVLELIAKEQNMPDASLRSWLIPGHPLSIEQALQFALQIARGMQHATEKIPGFVHRDLKPENILVGADKLPGTNINRLRVTDFGLATMLKDEIGKIKNEGGSEDVKRTQLTHGIIGTPLYMAPEQWKGELVGVFTDVYAFGCILYEMLTGYRVAVGNTITELQASHCTGKLQLLPSNFSKDIEDLFSKCLSINPSQRFGNWVVLAEAIANVHSKQIGISAPLSVASAESKHEDRRQAGWSYNEIGRSYAHMGKAEVAAGYFEKMLIIARETGYREEEGVALGNLGVVYADMGKLQLAIKYHEQGLAIERDTGNRHGEAAALGNLGVVYENLGDVQRAIRYHEQCLDLHRKIGDRHGEAQALGNLGLSYAAFGDLQQAIIYYEQQLVIMREIGNRRGEGVALANLGIACKNLGYLQQAFEYYEHHLIIVREIGDRSGEGSVLNNIGEVYRIRGDARRAIEYYEQSLAIAREIGNRYGEGISLGTLGIAYSDINKQELSLSYYEQALTILREVGNRRAEGAILGHLGVFFANLGNMQLAAVYYEKAIAIRREVGDLSGVAMDSFNMAILYYQQGDLVRALPLTQEAAQIWTRIGNPNAQRAQQLIDALTTQK